jgi:predicted nucleotidyltransferase
MSPVNALPPTAAEDLDKLIQCIALTAQPLKIILFGSAARGEMRPDSDLDLLVIVPDGTHRRHTAQRLYYAAAGIHTPFDLVVATQSDVTNNMNNVGLIYRTAVQEGQIVYSS